jgi:hypothetical protein
MRTFFIVLSILIIAMGVFIMGNNINNKVLPSMIFSESGIADNNGAVLVDTRGINGKIITSGIFPALVGNQYEEAIIGNYVVPTGKKLVTIVIPFLRTIPGSDPLKTLKCINFITTDSVPQYEWTGGYLASNVLTAGTYPNLLVRVTHAVETSYTYTDDTTGGSLDLYSCYYEVRESNI